MAEPTAAAKPRPRGSKMPLVLVAVLGLALVEAGVLVVVFKMRGGGPRPAEAHPAPVIEGEAATATAQPPGTAEVNVLRGFRVPNETTGQVWVYDMDISVVVAPDDQARVEELVKLRKGEIGDVVARIVRSAPDRMLRETDLRALRYRVLEALRDITGEETTIQRVLFPRFVPMRAD